MLNFNNLPEKKEFKRGKFIRPGIQNLILKDITLQVSGNTGNERPVFNMETEPIADEDWEPHNDAKYGGQIGNVAGNFNYYLKTQEQKMDFISNLKDIMSAVGTFDAFMDKHSDKAGETNFDNLSDVVEAVKPFVVGKTARYFVAGEQYAKLDNSGVGLKLKFPSRKMVESVDSESKFPKFDETNQNHFKKLDKTTIPQKAVDDLPF